MRWAPRSSTTTSWLGSWVCVRDVREGHTCDVAADDEVCARKLATNQSTFRTSNERLGRAAYGHRFEPRQRVPFSCECGDENCYEIVMLSLEEYEHVRSHPTWFLLVAGHEDDEVTHEPDRGRRAGLRGRREDRGRRRGGGTPSPAPADRRLDVGSRAAASVVWSPLVRASQQD